MHFTPGQQWSLRNLGRGISRSAYAVSCGFFPYSWQKAVLDSRAKFKIIDGARQSGKSTIVSVIPAHKAKFKSKSLSLVIAPTRAQANEDMLKIKELAHNDPDYPTVKQQIQELVIHCREYSSKNRLRMAPNYFKLFFQYQTDHEMTEVCDRLEELVTILSNSRDAAILEYLNKLPVLTPHAHTRPFERKRLNQLLGIIIPAGLFFYFRIWFYRVRLYKDLNSIQTYGERINLRIENIITT